jgi:uncharacterized protein HemX
MDSHFSFAKLPDKKSLIYLIIAAVFASAIFAVVMYYISWTQLQTEKQPQAQEETLVQKQLKELDRLRQEAGATPPTEEQIAEQKEELDALRKDAKAKPASEATIQQQMGELDKLRAAAK